jgi:hypothetical protein
MLISPYFNTEFREKFCWTFHFPLPWLALAGPDTSVTGKFQKQARGPTPIHRAMYQEFRRSATTLSFLAGMKDCFSRYRGRCRRKQEKEQGREKYRLKPIHGALKLSNIATHHMSIYLCSFHTRMAEQILKDSDIHPVFQHMGGKAVALMPSSA